MDDQAVASDEDDLLAIGREGRIRVDRAPAGEPAHVAAIGSDGEDVTVTVERDSTPVRRPARIGLVAPPGGDRAETAALRVHRVEVGVVAVVVLVGDLPARRPRGVRTGSELTGLGAVDADREDEGVLELFEVALERDRAAVRRPARVLVVIA
jgi:hypothetical protein